MSLRLTSEITSIGHDPGHLPAIHHAERPKKDVGEFR